MDRPAACVPGSALVGLWHKSTPQYILLYMTPRLVELHTDSRRQTFDAPVLKDQQGWRVVLKED